MNERLSDAAHAGTARITEGGAAAMLRQLPPGWFWYDDAAFDLTFACPRKGVSGAAVAVNKELRPDGAVVHVSTDDFSEVYFELRQASTQTAAEAVAGLKQSVSERFTDARFGDDEPAELAGRPARGMTFEFEDRVRRALHTTGTSPLYVVIYDPRSLLNELIVASLSSRPWAADPAESGR